MDPLCAPSDFVDVGEDLCEGELNTSATVAETFQEDTIRSFFPFIIRISIKKWSFAKEKWHY